MRKRKISASEYYSLPTIRKLRRMIRANARRHRIAFIKCSWKLKKSIRVRLKFYDDNGGNILKVRRYKGKIRNGGKL